MHHYPERNYPFQPIGYAKLLLRIYNKLDKTMARNGQNSDLNFSPPLSYFMGSFPCQFRAGDIVDIEYYFGVSRQRIRYLRLCDIYRSFQKSKQI